MTLSGLTGSRVGELPQLLLAITERVKTTNRNVLNESLFDFNKMYYFYVSLKKKKTPKNIVSGIDFCSIDFV